MDWSKGIQSMADRFMENQEHREGDWTEDEILYCGVCKEARREYIEVQGVKLLVTRMCKCDRRQMEDEKAEKARQEEELRLNVNKTSSGIEPMYYGARLSTFDQADDNKGAYNLAKNYVAQFPEMLSRNQGLLFWGDIGTGKTYTACVIANELLDRGYTVYSLSFAKLFQQVNGSEEELMYRVKTVDLLILDDLGTERTTDYGSEKVYAVIDARYRCGKPAIYTTNLTLTAMREVGDIRQKRIYDRIFQNCFPLQFNGQSRRLDEARARYNEMLKMTKR